MVTYDNNSLYYQIRSVEPNEIKISLPNVPDKIYTLIPDLNTGKWKFYGIEPNYRIDFISQEMYNQKQLEYLLSLPNELIIQLSLGLNIRDISNLCRSYTRLNNLLCNNQNFWKLKYDHDFPIRFKTIGKEIDWKSSYKSLTDPKKRATVFHIPDYPGFENGEYRGYTESGGLPKILADRFFSIVMERYGDKIRRGDIVQFDFYNDGTSQTGMTFFDGEKLIDLGNEYETTYGNLPSVFKLWEDPDYFVPRYWNDVEGGIYKESYVWADLSPYMNEIISNAQMSRIIHLDGKEIIAPTGQSFLFTLFHDKFGFKHHIVVADEVSIFLPSAEDLVQNFINALKKGVALHCNEMEGMSELSEELARYGVTADSDVFVLISDLLSTVRSFSVYS